MKLGRRATVRQAEGTGTGTEPAAVAKAWVKTETGAGRRATRRLVWLGACTTLLSIAQAWCVALVLGHAIATLGGAPYQSVAWMPLVGFTIAALLRAGLQFASGTRGAAIGADQRRRLRSDALGRLLDRGPAALAGRGSGAIVASLVDQIEGLDSFYARYLPALALASIGPVIVLLILLPFDLHAGLVLLACGFSVPVFQAVFGIGAARASRRQFTALSRLQVRFLDRVRGIGTIVLAGGIEDEAREIGAAADELRRRTMRILRVAFLSSTALDCALVVALVLVAISDRHALLDHPTLYDASRALFALLVIPEFFAPLRAFALAYQDKHRIVVASEELSALPPARPVESVPPPVRTVEAHGIAVAFDNVSFGWDEAGGDVLEGLSFRIPPGETALLIGPSGAGKSTVIDLLLGFVAPRSGRITLNGADLATIVPQALAAMTSWIGQRPVLFAGTVRENVRFARPDASEGELADAIRAARLETLMAELPDGLETRIGEGGFGLSGGQAQRVAVARAYLKNAPLLLLDEPTSHLDPATEAEMIDSLRRLALGRTVLLASHSAAAHAFSGRRIVLGSVGERAVPRIAGE